MTMIPRPKSLTMLVTDELLKSISNGETPFGAMLYEKTVAAKFGCSKTPVREAFFKLQALGLVEVIPQKGCLVYHPTIHQVHELCELRIVLECAAMTFAMREGNHAQFLSDLHARHEITEREFNTCSRAEFNEIDDAFHRTFFEHCNNSMLVAAYENIRPRIGALRINLQTIKAYLVDVSVSDHAEIIAGVQVNDVEIACSAIAKHIRRVSNYYRDNRIVDNSSPDGASVVGDYETSGREALVSQVRGEAI